MSESTAAALSFGTYIDEPPLSPAAPNGLRIARPAPAPERPAPVPQTFATPEPAQEPVEELPPVAASAQTLHVRLSNGDRIEAGSFADETSAHIKARELATAFAGGDWALLHGRYVRPEAVVSIDVETT